MSQRNRCRVVAAGVLLLALASGAQAAVYRCQQGGSTVYSDKPCAGDAQAYEPSRPIQVVPRTKARNLARDYDQRLKREQQERDRADAAWNRDYQARQREEDRLQQARRHRKVVAGMSAKEVRELMGDPIGSGRDESARGVSESWKYLTDDGSRLTVLFKDGVVVSTYHQKGRRK